MCGDFADFFCKNVQCAGGCPHRDRGVKSTDGGLTVAVSVKFLVCLRFMDCIFLWGKHKVQIININYHQYNYFQQIS